MDLGCHLIDGDVIQMLLGVRHRRADDRVLGGWQAQRGFGIEGSGHELGENVEEPVGELV